MRRFLLVLSLLLRCARGGRSGRGVDLAGQRPRAAAVLVRSGPSVRGGPASRHRRRRRSRARRFARPAGGVVTLRRHRAREREVGDDPHLRRLVGDAHPARLDRGGEGRDGRRGRRGRDDRPERRRRGERPVRPARRPPRRPGSGVRRSADAASAARPAAGRPADRPRGPVSRPRPVVRARRAPPPVDGLRPRRRSSSVAGVGGRRGRATAGALSAGGPSPPPQPGRPGARDSAARSSARRAATRSAGPRLRHACRAERGPLRCQRRRPPSTPAPIGTQPRGRWPRSRRRLLAPDVPAS